MQSQARIIHTKSTKTLISFFENDYDIIGRKLNFCLNHYNNEEKGFCQCYTEKFIEQSSDKVLMRSFLMISIFFDQLIYTHYSHHYNKFRSKFCFPKLFQHGLGGHANPSWFIYRYHGYDKKVNWHSVRDVTKIITTDILNWFEKETNVYEETTHFKEFFKNIILYELKSFERFPDRVLLSDIIEETFL